MRFIPRIFIILCMCANTLSAQPARGALDMKQVRFKTDSIARELKRTLEPMDAKTLLRNFAVQTVVPNDDLLTVQKYLFNVTGLKDKTPGPASPWSSIWGKRTDWIGCSC